jgi:hypothetical protein
MSLDPQDPLLQRFLSAIHSHCEETYAAHLQQQRQQQQHHEQPQQPPPQAAGAPVAAASAQDILRSSEEIVGYLAPAPSVRSRFQFAPDAPRRPTIGGRVVSAATYATMTGAGAGAGAGAASATASAAASAAPAGAAPGAQQVCPLCLPFLQSLGPSKELSKARELVCTHRYVAPAPAAAAAAPGGAGRGAASAAASAPRPLPRPALAQRKDTPDGYWSGRTDDVPSSLE